MEELRKKYMIVSITSFFLTVILIPLFSFIYGKTNGEILRNGIFALFFALGLIYFLYYSFNIKEIEYDNFQNPYRFLITYSVSMILCVSFPLVDISGWLYLGIAVSLTLYSSSLLSLYITPSLIIFSFLLSGNNDITGVFVYIIASFIGIILFQDIDQNFKVGFSIFISVLCLFVLETAGFVLLKNEEFTFEEFIIPIVNTLLNSIIIFWCLKYFNEFVANKYRNKYLELNDQEYKVLVELKKKSIKDYYRTIHTAYLVDRLAQAVGCDENLAKNLSYYYRIKSVFNYSNSASDKFVNENKFPPDAAKQLINYWNKKTKIISKEESIVYIADKMIFSLLLAFEKDKNAKVDYAKLYDALYQKDFMNDALTDSDLSVKDFRLIREIILKENLYYDFLR